MKHMLTLITAMYNHARNNDKVSIISGSRASKKHEEIRYDAVGV